MKTSEMLDKAADLIEREGHWRGGDGVRVGHCVITAISSVGFNEYLAALEAAERAISPRFVSRWSDDSPTAEVIAMLRACAMTERAREARLLPVVRETVTA